MPATMPGTVHYALQKLGKISDPYHARNELDVQWIDEQDWELSRSIRVSDGDCQRARQELIFDGLDTIATIRLNGKKVGHSVNMFRQVVCDVSGVLRPGDNQLSILFESPTAYAAAEHKRHGSCASNQQDFVWQTGERRQTCREWIRKTQCHFGWDWGVYLATSGVWQPARLECSDAPRIASTKTHQTHHGRLGEPTRVDLEITTFLDSSIAQRGQLKVRCGDQEVTQTARLRAGENRVKAKLSMESPKLWWPAGEGEQHLYKLSIHWQGENGSQTALERRIGLRTVELVTEDDAQKSTEAGQSFFFRVNGRAIFARGADWIPVDQFVDRAQPAVYRHLLGSMREAHMNMVRVWGGGWYEQEIFYDLCDELGLLVWQDFMMACALYPAHQAFVDELSAEAQYQVRRLHDHACIALWCGDNENAAGLMEWWVKKPNFKTHWASYKRTLTALRKTCEREDTTRRFWLSSPSNNDFEAHPNDPKRGNVHSWDVWHRKKPFSNYLTVKPRFVSEFGFQSFPEPRTIRKVVPEEHCNPSSRVMEHHQRSNEGNLRITNTMARELPIPKDFDTFCWASQINQALAIRTAVEHWRRLKPYCMGALFWQINDLWPAASWSSIDYFGRWKVLQHEAVRFFAPLLVSLQPEDGKLNVWLTSDLPDALSLAGELVVLSWAGKRITKTVLKTRLRPLESWKLASIPFDKLLAGKTEAHEVCCFVTLKGSGHIAANYTALVPWKWITLPKPKTKTTLRERNGKLEAVVQCEAVTPFFHAELNGTEGHFVGDWRVLRPGTHVLPYVFHDERATRTLTLAAARKRLSCFSFYDLSAHRSRRC